MPLTTPGSTYVSDACQLRTAIADASVSRVVLLGGWYDMTDGCGGAGGTELAIARSMSLEAAPGGTVTLDGGRTSSAPTRLLSVASSCVVELHELVFHSATGPALLFYGTVTMRRCVVRHSQLAIRVDSGGRLTMHDCLVHDNGGASDGGSGCGLHVGPTRQEQAGGEATLLRCVFTDNDPGPQGKGDGVISTQGRNTKLTMINCSVGSHEHRAGTRRERRGGPPACTSRAAGVTPLRGTPRSRRASS
jgi:hypothetical protein